MQHFMLTLAATLAFAATTANAADPPLIGTWADEPNTTWERELFVRDTTNPKAIEGWYCSRHPGSHQVT